MLEFEIQGGNPDAQFSFSEPWSENGVEFITVNLHLPTPQIPQKFTLKFKHPAKDVASIWNAGMAWRNTLQPSWWKSECWSRYASGMPLHQNLSMTGRNRLLIALSDAANATRIATGILEYHALIDGEINFFTELAAPLTDYACTIRVDTRDIPYYDSVYDTVTWWETACGYKPTYVPEMARRPLDSLWYSFHQGVNTENIVNECKQSKELGMDVVIVDDGWQCENNFGGYGYCGDWELAEGKIPDIKDLVNRLHAIDMKVMFWFSVPFIGRHTKVFEKLKGRLLAVPKDGQDWWCIDPRYKENRDYLIAIYTKAIKEWNLDGLKLDFIDSFKLTRDIPELDPARDYVSLEDGVDALMSEAAAAMRAIKPDVLIEFRQGYVGPAIRQYGNMLRVNDCPQDYMRNRTNGITMRMTSGKTAIHSDMLMWNYDEPVESAALQIANILYLVPQISMRIERLRDDHKKMLQYYLAFWREYRDILLDGKLVAANPEGFYSIAAAILDNKAVYTCYTDTAIRHVFDELVAVNASNQKSLIVRGYKGRAYTVKNCMGEVVEEGTVNADLTEITVPLCGMLFVK